MKKLTQMLALAGVAALCLSAGNSFAQDNGGPGGGGEQGGPGGGRGGRGGRGNFDPAQMQQQFNERIKTAFGSTDEEWKAIEPLVAKVNELRRDQMMRGFRGAFGRGGRGGQGGGPGFGPEPSAEETALNDAVEKNASKDDLKATMAAYRKAKAEKEAALKKAQDDIAECDRHIAE